MQDSVYEGDSTATARKEPISEYPGLIILGNSGVGKSFLANIIVREESFVHKASATAVTTRTESIQCNYRDERYVIFNIPGLIESDQERIDINKQEIEKAFNTCPNSVIIYVFGAQTGRIRNEDVIALKALNDAYSFKEKSLIFVINGIPRQNRPSNYQGETIAYLKNILGKTMSNNICFLDNIDPTNPMERDQLRGILMKDFCNLIPDIHEKQHDIQLQMDQINLLRKDLQKQKIEFDREHEEMKEQFLKAQKTYEERQKDQ